MNHLERQLKQLKKLVPSIDKRVEHELKIKTLELKIKKQKAA